ncbi:MAG: hypothetical protein V3T72_22325 [Thermoanaerobaculia bacterium]
MQRMIRITLSIALAWAASARAQNPPVAPAAQLKTLAATMNVYVFPADGQNQEVQNRHEAECYSWAVHNTKVDPFELQKQAEQQMQTAEQQQAAVREAGQGAGVKGAVAGAARGALIGEIADNDAGGGAARGAAIGAVRARRKARRAQQQATQQIDQQTQQTQQATAEQIDGFKNAFSVCLEAKNYMVKM